MFSCVCSVVVIVVVAVALVVTVVAVLRLSPPPLRHRRRVNRSGGHKSGRKVVDRGQIFTLLPREGGREGERVLTVWNGEEGWKDMERRGKVWREELC